jgi:hypothetical protein
MGVDQIGYAGWAPKRTVGHHHRPAREDAGGKGWPEGRRQDHLALDGKPVPALAAMVESLEVTKDKPITLTVLRNGEQKTFTLQPVLSEKRYRIGIGTMQMKVKTLPFGPALDLSLHENRQNALLILRTGQEDGAAQDAR